MQHIINNIKSFNAISQCKAVSSDVGLPDLSPINTQ